jgi:hypothetical protein
MNPLLEPDYSGGQQPAENPLLAALKWPPGQSDARDS